MDWNARLREAFGASPMPDADVLEELTQHAHAMYERARADGVSRDEAETRVTQQIREWVREAPNLRRRPVRPGAIDPPAVSTSASIATLWQDARYAARLLMRQRRFSLLAILTIALGIAGSTLIFSVLYTVVMKPLAWPGADRIVVLKETRGGTPPRFMSFTNTAYVAWQQEASTLEEMAAWSLRGATLTGAGDPERLQIAAVTPSLFRLLGMRPVAGAFFDDRDSSAPVVVISEGLWRERFGGDGNIVGRAVRLDEETLTVVGVLPADQAYPTRQVRAWVPFRVRPPAGNYLSMFNAIGRLRPGVTPSQAAAEGTSRGQYVADTGMTTMAVFGNKGPVGITATPLKESLTAEVRKPLFVLFGAVALLLLVAVTNVASLQLAHAAGRRREFAIRSALGASGGRIVGQLFAESVLLGIAGGVAGAGIAYLLHGSLSAILPADFPRVGDLAFDPPVAAFAAAISLVVTIAFGWLPALRMRRLNLVASLGEHSVAADGSRVRRGLARTRLSIIGGQVAITALLLTAAALLGRSFIQLLNEDRGFQPSEVMSAGVAITGSRYTPERRYELVRAIVDELSRGPQGRAAAYTSEHPLIPGGSTASFNLRRPDRSDEIAVQASPRIVSEGYFAALGQRVIAGRVFGEGDIETSARVVVVNESFVRRYLPGGAIDVRIPVGFWGEADDPQAAIIGVVEDVKYVGNAELSRPEMFVPLRQMKNGLVVPTATLLVRLDGDRAAAARDVRRAVQGASPDLAAGNIMTLEDRLLATSLARPRLYALLLTGFAAIALVLTGVGLFAVLSQLAGQRTRELGIRAALGAGRANLIRVAVGPGLVVTVIGLAAGLFAARLVARLAGTLLHGVSPVDPASYAAVAAIVLTTSIVACLVPALRAARLDPLRALRS